MATKSNRALKYGDQPIRITTVQVVEKLGGAATIKQVDVNRPGFPGECFICELRLPDHRFRWKHNKLFLLLPEEY
ncbi:hypothetical protein MMU43_22830, partial [Escherichia coli]|nr:hypothetical protein [Escherichia coli]MCH6328807.1 hypothetical protein [Escherichia coli]